MVNLTSIFQKLVFFEEKQQTNKKKTYIKSNTTYLAVSQDNLPLSMVLTALLYHKL